MISDFVNEHKKVKKMIEKTLLKVGELWVVRKRLIAGGREETAFSGGGEEEERGGKEERVVRSYEGEPPLLWELWKKNEWINDFFITNEKRKELYEVCFQTFSVGGKSFPLVTNLDEKEPEPEIEVIKEEEPEIKVKPSKEKKWSKSRLFER